MYTDKKVLHTISISSLAVLLLALILPGESSGRITAAVLLLPLAIITYVFVKKRCLLSYNKRQILMLMSVIAAVYLVIYYLTGLYFGFSKSLYLLRFDYIIPIVVIVVASEIIRNVLRAQESKLADVLGYFICLVAEVLIFSNLTSINTFNKFMDLAGMTLFPAVIYNLLYHYLSKRYGILPNVVYRLITGLYLYLIPYTPAVPDSLVAFAKLVVPILIYIFIDSLYEKRRRYASEKKSKVAIPLTLLALAIMASLIMLISNQFRFGSLVIATESMTGEINKGDIVIFDQDDEQIFVEGQVVVFKKGLSMIVHRIVKIEHINGSNRYYTKGDANETDDSGYITDSDILGSVKAKLPYFGYPTLWLREIVSKAVGR